MGNNQPLHFKNPHIIAAASTLTHPKFLYANIVQKSFGQSYMQLTVQISNKKIYSQWKQRINTFVLSCKNHLPLMLPKSVEYQQDRYYGTKIMKVKFEKFPYTMSQEIECRLKTGRKFKQNEIWYIVYILIMAAGQLHRFGKILGDVRPINTFINSQGQILLGNICTFYDQQSNYEKKRLYQQNTYIAPQMLDSLSKGHDCTVNEVLAQNFSVGLTLLDIVLLSSSENLYNRSYTFNTSKLKEKLRQLDNYIQNKQLKQIIQGLCEINPEDRAKCQDIIEGLYPYELKILNLDSFDSEYIGHKIKLPKLRSKTSILTQSNSKQSLKINPFEQILSQNNITQEADTTFLSMKSPTQQSRKLKNHRTQLRSELKQSRQHKQTIQENSKYTQLLKQKSQSNLQKQVYHQSQYYNPRKLSQTDKDTSTYRSSRSFSRGTKTPNSDYKPNFLGGASSPRISTQPQQIYESSFSSMNYSRQKDNNLNNRKFETSFEDKDNTFRSQSSSMLNSNSKFYLNQKYSNQGYQQFLKKVKQSFKRNKNINLESQFSNITSPRSLSEIFNKQEDKYESLTMSNPKESEMISTAGSWFEYPIHNPETNYLYSKYESKQQEYGQYNDILKRVENQLRQTKLRFPQI